MFARHHDRNVMFALQQRICANGSVYDEPNGQALKEQMNVEVRLCSPVIGDRGCADREG